MLECQQKGEGNNQPRIPHPRKRSLGNGKKNKKNKKLRKKQEKWSDKKREREREMVRKLYADG